MQRFAPVFVSSVFLSLHYGAILYVNSSLLAKFFDSNIVSTLFIVGALGSILLFLFTAKFIELFGKRLLLFILLSIAMISTLGLAFTETSLIVIVSFIAYASTILSIYYCLDIFLEEISRDTNTGEVRGIYLTLINIGIALGPIMVAIFAKDDVFAPLYIIATLLLSIPIVLSLFSFKPRMPKWHGQKHRHIFLPFSAWWRNKNVRRVTFARLILESFFAFMVIYTPVYLHNEIGFDWSELGIIFTVMLLPFILFQWPAGELADRFFGEKEIMSIGFIITALALFFMPFIGKVFWLWLTVLFLSRVGASFVEVMTESYFFKHVDAEDTGLISIFRLTRPTSTILGAGFGLIALNFLTIENLFLVLAFLLLFGLKESLFIKDTK